MIRRAPELALVDELAHTNAQGSRNEKRYQDIDEILDAGIDVISTVNIQHLESLNDAVFELTGVRVRETFPDRMLDDADEVILVDISPEALQDRLRAGKVYPGGQAERALLNFFRQDNLSALRELALREVAEDVEHRRGTAVLDPFSKQAVGERVLALVEPQPRSQRVLRSAWRSSQRLGGEIDALWMRRPGQQLAPEEATQLAALRRLASILGVHFLEEEGTTSSTPFAASPPSRLDVHLRRHSRRAPLGRDHARFARLAHDPRAAWDRHPGRRPPRPPRRTAPMKLFGRTRSRASGRGSPAPRTVRRSPARSAVLDAALRIARAEDSVLVPAYLLVVPLEFSLERLSSTVSSAARCRSSKPSSSPRGAQGCRWTHASSGDARRSTRWRLWEVESFDRVVVPAPRRAGQASPRRT